MSATSEAASLVPGRWELGPDGPSLLGSRCERCHRAVFPTRVVCPRCKRRTMSPVNLGQRATLYSFTVCHVAPEGWEAPYLQAYVQLPERLRVFSLISSSVEPTSGTLRVGMEMELVIEPVRAGSDVLTFKYRPANPDA